MSFQCGKFGFIAVIILSFHWTMCNSKTVSYTFIAAVGSPATLKCQRNPGKESTIEWIHDRGAYGDSAAKILCKMDEIYNKNYSVEANFSTGTYNLIIENVTLEMSGTYMCTCDDDGVLVETVLIVFETNKPHSKDVIERSETTRCLRVRKDSYLESNSMCNIKRDTVRLHCAMSYMDSSGRHSNDAVCKSDVFDYEYIKIGVKEIHSMIGKMCQANFTLEGVSSDLTGSVPTNTHVTCSNVSKSTVDCDQNFVDCYGVDQKSCTYVWMNENMTMVNDSEQLNLVGKPEGKYLCIANCSVNQFEKWCSFVAKQIRFTCNEDVGTPATNSSHHSLNTEGIRNEVYYGIVGVVLAGAFALVVVMLLLRFRRATNIHETPNSTERENDVLL